MRMKNDFYVVQANDLIRARQDHLSLTEAKLVRLVISQIAPNDEDLHVYTFKLKDLASYLEVASSNLFRDISEITHNLMKKVITITPRTNSNQKALQIHWVDYVEYDGGIVKIKLSDQLRPYVVGLRELYTKYGSGILQICNSTFAIRLYELLCSYQNMILRDYAAPNPDGIPLEANEFVFSVTYLRDFFDCGEKYPQTSDFIKRVISPTVEFLHRETELLPSYRIYKAGRSITHIIFKIRPGEGKAAE